MDNVNNMKKIYDETFEAFELQWDTEYFGVSSGRAILKETVPAERRIDLKNFLDSFEFVTISNVNNNPHNNIWLGLEFNVFLSDMNLQFERQVYPLSKQIDGFVDVNIYESYPQDEHIVELARTSFIHSRFFNDPWLSLEKAKNIYSHWVESAFNKPGRYFIIAKKNGIIAGFLLFSIDHEHSRAIIELIGVDARYQGQNIGRSLINKLEMYLWTRNITRIKVGTQIENDTAIKFYLSCGFTYAGCNAVYHYWPNKTNLRWDGSIK